MKSIPTRTITTLALLIILTSSDLSIAAPATKATQSINLTNTHLQITGSAFVHRTTNRITYPRFDQATLDQPTTELNFNATKAKTSTGVALRFRTNSKSIRLRFEPLPGENRGSEFGVYQNGTLIQEYKFQKKDTVIEFTFDSTPPSTTTPATTPANFTIALPSWSDSALTGLWIEPGATLSEPTRPHLNYLALGDSISHGTGQGSATHKTWPWLLSHKIDASLYSLAVGGGKISVPAAQLASNLPSIDLVTILIGYNDWNAGVAPAAYQQKLHQAATIIHKAHPKATLVFITPTFTKSSKPKSGTHTLDEFRAAVVAVTTALQKAGDQHVLLYHGEDHTDQRNLRDDSPDLVHFSVAGAARMADSLNKWLKKRWRP